MTREQGYEKLELPVGTDLQVVRQKFQQMHNDFQVQIDGAFNEAMRQRKEQQLEELKEAYAVLNESRGMDDSASLPRTERSFDKYENKQQAQSSENATPDLLQALAVFGLSKEQDVESIVQVMQTHIDDLIEKRNSISLPEVREGYDRAITKAESAKAVISDWLQQREQSAAKEPPHQKQAAETASEQARPAEKQQTKSGSKTGLYIGITALVIAIGIGGYYFTNRGGSTAPDETNTDAGRDSSTWEAALIGNSEATYQHYLKQYPEGIFAQTATDSLGSIKMASSGNTPHQPQDTPPVQAEPANQQDDAAASKSIERTTSPVNMDANALYRKGHALYTKHNETEAVIFIRPAAEQGHASAQYDLGDMYYWGRGVAQDYTEAVKWYRKAANQDHIEAQISLGNRYSDGVGVVRDQAEAVKWYKKAANQGHASTQYRLGDMYSYGKDVAKDETEAVEWYKKAANQGHESAQFSLGRMYEDGRGVAKDETEAIKWLKKAAKQGNQTSINNLKRRGITEYD